MGTLSQSAKAEIAEQLELVETWVNGPSRARVADLRKRFTGEGSLTASDKEEIARELRRIGQRVSGPRAATVESLTARVLGEDDPNEQAEGHTPSGANTGGSNQPNDQGPDRAPKG